MKHCGTSHGGESTDSGGDARHRATLGGAVARRRIGWLVVGGRGDVLGHQVELVGTHQYAPRRYKLVPDRVVGLVGIKVGPTGPEAVEKGAGRDLQIQASRRPAVLVAEVGQPAVDLEDEG